jgi:predicted metal-binding protein
MAKPAGVICPDPSPLNAEGVMNRTEHVSLSTPCAHKDGAPCQAGYDLINRLRRAIEMAGDTVAEDFEISGTACVTGCNRTCTLAYHSTRDTSHVFGDVSADADVTDLLKLADQYRAADDGWNSGVDTTALPAAARLTRLPAAMVAVTPMVEAVS